MNDHMNACVRMNDQAMEKKKWGSVKLPRWLERRVWGALTGYVRVGSGSVIRDGVSIACMGHPTAPYLSLGSRRDIRSTLVTHWSLLDGDSMGVARG